MNAEIYGKMRVWENMGKIIMDDRRELRRYAEGETKNLNPDHMWLLNEQSVPERIAEITASIERTVRDRNAIASELAEIGIDVEYVVTGFYKELKPRAWLRNYSITRERVEHTGYVYEIREGGDGSYRKTFGTLEDAVTEIIGYYAYMNDNLSVEDTVAALKWSV